MPFPRTELPVLLYHHVGPVRSRTLPVLTVDPRRFQRHLAWLRRRNYGSLTLDQVAAWAIRGEPLPEQSVLITFDDSYADLTHHAFPLLRAAGYSAVVFVVTGRLGGFNAWDEPLGAAGHRLLDEDAIRLWSQRGIEFGAHTRTHPKLGTLAPADLEAEIQGSRDDLEELLQGPVSSFAYPYGVLDSLSIELASRIFQLAFTGADGPNVRGVDPHLIGRTGVKRSDMTPDIAFRVRYGRSPRQDVRTRVGRAALRGLEWAGVHRARR